jgi:2-dehydro-3-deoxyphosphogluconate aldolase / (4S)-4-hydroxy-2-oxoglutarate aldolase
MTYRWEVSARIARERVVAIIRSASAAEAVQAGRSLFEAGIQVLEVALTTPGGIGAIRELAGELAGDQLLGAGTVLDEAMADAAIEAGARFLVSPGLVHSVLRAGGRHGVPTLPGAGTATEIIAAMEAGAEMVKLFPASALGTGFVRAIRPVLPAAALVPTGGVSADSAREWLDAGAVAVGVGGALTSGDRLAISGRARDLLAAVHLAAEA